MKSISDPHGLTLFAQFEISGQRNDDGASEISAGVVRRSKVNRNLLSARRLWAGGGVFRSWFRTFRGWLTSPRRPVQPQTPAPDRAPSIPAQLHLLLYRVFIREFDLKLHAEKLDEILGPLPANFQAEMAAAQTAFGAARHGCERGSHRPPGVMPPIVIRHEPSTTVLGTRAYVVYPQPLM